MAQGVKAGSAYVSITAEMSGLQRGVDNAKKVMNQLRASAQALGKAQIGRALALGITAIGTAVSAVGSKVSNIGSRLNSFGKSIAAFGTRIMGFAAVGLTGLYYVTKRFIEMGDAINKMSARTGATVEWLSAMGYAAERSGATIELLEQAIRRLNKAVSEAQSGKKTPLEAFSKLNINPNSPAFKNAGVGAQFELVAKRLNALKSQADKTRVAMELFGKSGTMLLPMLGSIDELKKKAQELGIIMTKEQADSAAALLDAWTNVKAQLSIVFASLGQALAPALMQIAQMLSRWAQPINNFIKRHREWIILLFKGLGLFLIIGGAIATVGAILAGVGVTIKYIGSMIMGVGSIIKGIGVVLAWIFGKIGLIGKGFAAAFSAINVYGLSLKLMLLNPFAAILGAVMAVSWAVNKLLYGFRALFIMVSGLGATMSKFMYSFFVQPFIAAGRALKVSFGLISVMFRHIIGSISFVFSTLGGMSLATWGWIAALAAVVGILGYVLYKTDALGKLWQWLKGVWQDVCDYFGAKWQEMVDGLGDSLKVIWDAVMLGNFKGAWNLLCKDLKLIWKIWTLDIVDTWQAVIVVLKNGWTTFTTALQKGWAYTVNGIAVAWEWLKGKIAYGWEWIAGSCKVAFNLIILWVKNAIDDLITGLAKSLNIMRSYVPGLNYSRNDAERENRVLDEMNRRNKAQREYQYTQAVVDSENKLRQIEARTQGRIRMLNEELKRKIDAYNETAELVKGERDAGLMAEMKRRRDDIEKLKQEIATETANLKAQNEKIRAENHIKGDKYYKVWDSIEDNTAMTAENTKKDDTADFNARAITVKWGGLQSWAGVVSSSIRQIAFQRQQALQVAVKQRPSVPATSVQPPAKEQQKEAAATTRPNVDPAVLNGIASRMEKASQLMSGRFGDMSKSIAGLGDKAQKMLDKLIELTRNSKRYAEDIEQMLTVK